MSDPVLAEVLLVDRDPEDGQSIKAFLSAQQYEVEWVDDSEKAFNCLDTRYFDVLVTELESERVNGMRLMGVAQARNPVVCVVFIAEEEHVERATQAMQQGAYDYQTKPVNLQKLEAVIGRGVEYQRLVYEKQSLKKRLDERYGLGNLVGQSRRIIQVFDALRQAAQRHTPVVISGEEGTGKKLIAQAIHNSSLRRDEPFVHLDCSSLSESLIESELFGFSAGFMPQFDGAREGRLSAADRGTLLLIGVDKLTRRLQKKLLHVLNEGEYARLGDGKRFNVDARIIVSATTALGYLEDRGSFAPDLKRALSAAVLEVPALRDRREDIPALADHFIGETGRVHDRTTAGMTSHAMSLLVNYDWPGNVRELKSTIEGMVMMADKGAELNVNHVPKHILSFGARQSEEIRIPAGIPMRSVERIVIESTMKACGFSKEACAKTLGISLRTLYRKLREYENR